MEHLGTRRMLMAGHFHMLGADIHTRSAHMPHRQQAVVSHNQVAPRTLVVAPNSLDTQDIDHIQVAPGREDIQDS